MNTDFLSPLNLTVEPFTIGGNGSMSTPDAKQLINPNREAMLIDEFKVSVGMSSSGSTGAFASEFASVLAKLTFGSTPLTNDFLPLYSFMPLYFGYPQATGAGHTGDATLTWHLARPLYVPPDVQVSVSFLRKLPFSSWSAGEGGINVDQLWGFSMNGRSMPAGMQIPEKIYVPWACATSIYNSTVPYVSTDAEIGNPFDEPLNIDYFAGFNMREGFIQGFTPITVQMTLSNSKVIIRDPTPLNLLFPPDRPILRCRALLQPKEFVSTVIDVPDPVVSETDAIFTTIGMTGWREMKTPLGALP